MLHFLKRHIIISHIFTNVIIILMSYPLSNAEDSGELLDIGIGISPFRKALSKGFHPGGSIVVNGTVNPHSEIFSIYLENDSGTNVYLFISPRLIEKHIVFSNKDNGNWSPGYDPYKRSLSGLSPGANFTITVLYNATGYMINVNKSPVFFFTHRFDTSRISYIKFSGSVTIASVLYISGNKTCQFEGCAGDREECIFEDNQFQCQCIDGYSGHYCQDSCKVTDCTGSNVCVFSNKKYLCRSRTDLAREDDSSSIQCRPPYIAIDSECVWVVKSKLNWDAARHNCTESDGFLMEPEFPINFKQYLSNNYPEEDWGVFWIGGADRGLRRWIWVNSLSDIGDDFPWGKGEPNDGSSRGEDCMNLHFRRSNPQRPYFYNDGPCNADNFYICEAHPTVSILKSAALREQWSRASNIQVAILLLLIITIVTGAGVIINKQFNITKKAFSSFGSKSESFSKLITGNLSDDKEDTLIHSDNGFITGKLSDDDEEDEINHCDNGFITGKLSDDDEDEIIQSNNGLITGKLGDDEEDQLITSAKTKF